MDGDGLLQIKHAFFVGGVDHGWEEHASTGVKIAATSRMNAEIFVSSCHIFGIFGAADAIHGEHTSPLMSTKSGVIGVVVEDQDIPGLGL